jgi:hypothetical protein
MTKIVAFLLASALLAVSAAPERIAISPSGGGLVDSFGSCFQQQALAPRALEQLQAYCKHVDAFANRWCKTWHEAYVSGDPYSETTRHVEAWFPETLVQMRDTNPLGSGNKRGPPKRATREITRLHTVSIQAMEYLNLFTESGVMSNPLIRDKTGDAGLAPTTSEALEFLKNNPTTLAVFPWHDNVPPWTELLEAAWGGPLPLSPEEHMRRWRQQVRDIRLVWLVRADAELWPRAKDLRNAMADVDDFVNTIGQIKSESHEGFAAFVGFGAKQKATRGDAAARDPVLIRRLLQEAYDIAVWDYTGEPALRLLDEAARFAELRLKELRSNEARADFYARSIQIAREAVQKLSSDASGYRRRERDRTLRSIRRDAYEFLRNRVTWPLTVTVPGDDVDIAIPGEHVTVTGSIYAPGDARELQAPWLRTVKLLVQRSVNSDPSSPLPNVMAIPIALVDTTGERRVRPLRAVGNPADAYAFYEAEFLDTEPGRYHLQLPQLDEPPPFLYEGPAPSPSGNGTIDGIGSDPRRDETSERSDEFASHIRSRKHRTFLQTSA